MEQIKTKINLNFANYREFEITEFNWFGDDIYLAVGTFRKFVENNEKTIEEAKAQYKKELENDEFLKSDASEESKSLYEYDKYDHEEKTIEKLKYVQRDSVFLTSFSFFESNLRDICILIEKKVEIKLEINDLRGNGIEQYWTYLTKVIELDTSSFEKHFTPINQLKDFRNKLVHEGSKMDEKLKRILSQTKGIKEIKGRFFIEESIAS